MSVQKLHPEFIEGKLTHESKPYTMITNKVLQNCNNLEALALWCYLQSLPESWNISPAHLQKKFNVGKNKIYELLNYLICTNLLVRKRVQCTDGTYAKTEYIVKNGSEFIINNQELKNSERCAQPLPRFPDVDNPDVDNRDTINKIKSINKKESTKEILCASDDAHKSFEKWWDLQINKKNRKRALELWIKNKLYERADEIIEKTQKLFMFDQQWQSKQFSPHPTTQLRNERWEDEIILASSPTHKPNETINPVQYTIDQLKKSVVMRGASQ